MPAFKITLLGLLSIFTSLALGSKCPQDSISKLVVCYYKGETSLTDLNICNCTHLVFTDGVRRAENNSISAKEDTIKLLELVKEKKENLSALFTFETKPEETSWILKSENRSEELMNAIVEFLQKSQFDGIELNFKFSSDDGVPKESYASFVKSLSKTLSSVHRRVKRDGYDVFEKVQDDVTTASYTTQTPKNSTSKTQSIKQTTRKSKQSNRKIREDKKEEEDEVNNDETEKNIDYATLEEAINEKFSEEKSQITLKDLEEEIFEEKKFLIFIRLPIKPEIVAKKYDLKALSRYSDILTVPTHDIVNSSEEHLTYHPSRLMGLSDILNTDSILDFLTGMGALKTKLVISLPATVLKFQLKDENKNTPRSPSRSKPQVIDQSQLCSLFTKNNWTIERDEDLTAPYAFSGKTWLAFEDEISINIKGKYILLRDLAGGAIYPIDADVNDGLCTNATGSGGYLSGVLHKNFESLERKPRALVLQSLQEEIHDTSFTNIEAGVQLSEYRIVRVVDHSGAVHVIRKNTKTQFECSRQGYFSHPLGCNKFYRCVKFDQYSDEFTVFEYDCPAGLAFDERWEVCVWPGSLPHGAPCTGSSEIAPVPRSHYQCPNREGYYADPENCRWFFACLDHARDGITPLTAYEFRCPFGLVFSEEKLACDWPWLVGSGCGNRGAAGYLQVSAGGQTQGFHSATFINGGNLEASFGQFGNTEQEDSFIGFGKKFGSGLKGASSYSGQGAYQGAQSAGFGYIANQFDDDSNRASFAAFPDYEISGGRIFNKGGVVLDQNVAGISGVSVAGGSSGAAAGIATGDAGGFGGLHIGKGASGVVTGGATGSASAGFGGLHIGSGSSGSLGAGVATGGASGFRGLHIGSGSSGGLSAGVATGGASGSASAGFGGLHIESGSAGSLNAGGAAGFGGLHIGSGSSESLGAEIVTGNAARSSSAGFGRLHIESGASGSLGAGVATGGTAGFGGLHIGSGSSESLGAGIVTGNAAGSSSAGFGGLHIGSGASGSLDAGAGYLHQNIGQFANGIQGTSNIKFQKLEPAFTTSSLDINSGGQASFLDSVSTPKPFAVNIPSVQINEEKHSEFSSHSTIGSTTPQTLIFKETPSTESIQLQGKSVSSSQGFTVTQPTVSVGIPAVTPTAQTLGLGVSEGFGATHLSTPSVSFVSSPKTEIHRFGKNKLQTKISLNQASVTAGVPVVTGTQTFAFGSGATGGKDEHVSIAVPSVTPKPGIGTFEYTASGFGVGISGSSTPTERPFTGFTQITHDVTDQGRKGLGKSTLSVEFPQVQTHVVNEGQNIVTGNIAVGQTGVSYGAPLATATPSVYSNGAKIGSESHLSVVSSGPTVTPIVHSTVDDKINNELRFNSLQSSYLPAVTPKTEFHTFSKITSNSGLNTVSTVTQKPDFQLFSQPGLNLNIAEGKSEAAVSYGVPAVTPQPDLNSFKIYQQPSSGVSVTPIAPFASPKVTLGVQNSFGQSGGFSQTVVPHSFETGSFQQEGFTQSGKTSYNVPLVTSGLKTEGIVHTGEVSHAFVTPQPHLKVSQPSTPAFGQGYSYSSSFKQSGGQFGTVQPFGVVSTTQKPAIIKKTEFFAPKLEQSNVLTEVSIEQQPIVSVGTISTTRVDQGYSTPGPLQKTFSPSSTVNFKSSFSQPQVTTPTPFVSITPSTQVTYDLNQPSPHSLNVFGKSVIQTQQQKAGVEFSGPALQQTVISAPGIFTQKSSHFKQEVKSFSPIAQVTTAIPPTYNQEISSTGFGTKTGFFGQTKAYLPPVTPKAEIFGSNFQQNSYISPAQFGTTERTQVLVQKEQPKTIISQNFDFIKTKPFGERRTEIVQQVPIQVSTPAPEYHQPVVTTSKPFTPREKLVELEISKSVEINPVEISQIPVGSPSPRPIVIEQQPLNLISQKTFPVKQVIQPFYKQQEKEIVPTQINNIPQNQFTYQQEIKTPAIVEQKQYLPPVVTQKPLVPVVSYSTAKTVEQPVIFSEGSGSVAPPAFPVFEPSRVSITTEKETVISGIPAAQFPKAPAKTVFVQQYENRQPQEVVSSKVNLLPTVTEFPQFTPSQSEEFTVQTHRNFQSQKINKFGSPVQNVFVQPEIPSTVRPSVFETSGQFSQFGKTQNLTSGGVSGIKYAINPNIAIPEPPREYILAQNAYTTVAPELVSTGQFQSTESIRSGFKSSTYLPPQAPSRGKSKATVISVGNINEDVREDNLQEIFDKYSGRFGQVINGKTDKIVTKVINGEGRGKIELDRQGSSTVQYEVSSTTPRPRSRGRQYHGAITSGLQATNKYEEYEIDGNGQRSFTGQNGQDGSKTTIDLKNLKLEKDKKTVIVVSQVSDANPILVGKLAGQCSCQSNMLELRGKGKKSKNGSRRKNKPSPTITNEYLPPFESSQNNPEVQILTQGDASTAAPQNIVFDDNQGVSFTSEQTYLSSSTTAQPEIVSSTVLSSLSPDGVITITPKAIYKEDKLKTRKKQFRGRTRYLPPVSLLDDISSVPLLSPVPASEIASTIDYSILKGDESRTQNEIDGGSAKLLAGAAFDRYGPGGWRSFDETLQGSIDCKRPGLFRHPKYCNKFYACNYDPWKERYTLHVFNCPIHLTYDSSISACNWPVRGPSCADDNLLV